MMDKFFFLVLIVITVKCEEKRSNRLNGTRGRRFFGHSKQQAPTCPLGETCTIDQNCKAPDGTSYCVKDILIKKCPDGQAICTLYDGSTGCSTCCDGIPECKKQSDEVPCNKCDIRFDRCGGTRLFRAHPSYLTSPVIKNKCNARWRLVYEHDANGKALSGSKAELRDALRKGAEVRIFNTESYVDAPETTMIVGDEVCGQHTFHVSKGSWSTFQTKVYWWFTVLCTTGDRSMSRWYVGSHSSATDSQDTTAMKWFIREVPDKTLLTIPTAGRNLNALIKAVEESGYGVTVKKELSQFNEEYYTVDNLEISPDGINIVAQAVWNLFTEAHKTVVKVSPIGHWVFKNFASDWSVESSKYLIGENRRDAVDTAVPSTSKWFFDPCWELIYANKANGNSSYGSIQTLIDAVLAGNRIKVMVKDRISRASVVYVNGGVVTALLPNLLKKSNISTLEDPAIAGAKWEWTLVNTNGKVETATYLVGDASGTTSATTDDIKWYVDRRQWQMILDAGPGNSVNSGSKTELTNKIKNGADVRFAWVSTNAIYTVMEADNIGFDGVTSNFGAMHIRSLVLKPVGNEYKFDILSGTPTWLFTITTNSGTVRSSKWEAGKHVSRGGDTTSNRVMWWIAN